MEKKINGIAKRIKMLRKEEGLTQAEFGSMIGVKGNTVTGYENGTRKPSDSILNYICLVFDVDQTWLRTGEHEMYLPKKVTFSALEKVLYEYNCNDLEMSFLSAYFGLKEKERDAFCELLKKMFPEAISAIAGEDPLRRSCFEDFQEALPLDDAKTADDLHAELARQIALEKGPGGESEVS